jgi:hypothetical protein
LNNNNAFAGLKKATSVEKGGPGGDENMRLIVNIKLLIFCSPTPGLDM